MSAPAQRLRPLGAIGLVLGLAGAFIGYKASAQDFAITNATVATGDGSGPIAGATVVVRGGKIVAAGSGVAVPAGVETIDGTGKWVTPGLFAAMTALGLVDADNPRRRPVSDFELGQPGEGDVK